MAYEYTRTVTDAEEAAILYYVPAGVKAELDRLIDAGIGHTIASYNLLTAKTVETEKLAIVAKYEKLEKADKDTVDALLAKVSAAEAPTQEEPMEP